MGVRNFDGCEKSCPYFITTKVLTFVLFYVMIITEQRKYTEIHNRRSKKKMIRKQNGNCEEVIFNSIAELVKFNRETERTEFYRNYHVSDEGSSGYSFTKTNSYEEAEDLLLHGWDEMAKTLNKKINVNVKSGNKTKTVYDVQGYQCSVPRYLQGIPTNMINNKKVIQKQKVLDIVKDFGYSGVTKSETIERESIKLLKAVNELESKGYRCNVSIVIVSKKGYTNNYVKMQVKIKNASQRMNIKQMAFPLVHPSMFRRIVFGIIERLEETKSFGSGYGWCTEYDEVKHLFKGSYFIPRIVSENEITDMEKYKVI